VYVKPKSCWRILCVQGFMEWGFVIMGFVTSKKRVGSDWLLLGI
jgi:hypothetical protein